MVHTFKQLQDRSRQIVVSSMPPDLHSEFEDSQYYRDPVSKTKQNKTPN